MLFYFGPRSSLLLPFVVPGLIAAAGLGLRAARRGSAPDALLGLLILLPTLSVSQWMLGFAGWFDSHDGYSTVMFYVPWHLGILLGPAYYLYFRSLTNRAFSWRAAWPHLLAPALEAGLFGVVALYDLGWVRGWQGRPLPDFFGTKGAAATARDALALPLALTGYALLLAYALRIRADYRRYRRYLNDNFSDPERLRFAGLRQLLALQVVGLGLSLVFTSLNETYNFSYETAWYFFALRGVLIYGLVAVGLQANYAAAFSPLRFGEVVLPLTVSPAAISGPAAPGLQNAALPDAAGLHQQIRAQDLAMEDRPLAQLDPEWLPAAEAETAATAVVPPPLLPELQPWREKLLILMEDEQPWLEPELTLTELAHRLRLAPALLSRVINTGCGQNFNDFVNTYRVQAAAERLANPRYGHYSVMGVGLDCGFNSKSTFNRVFKKLAGHPPSAVIRPKS